MFHGKWGGAGASLGRDGRARQEGRQEQRTAHKAEEELPLLTDPGALEPRCHRLPALLDAIQLVALQGIEHLLVG